MLREIIEQIKFVNKNLGKRVSLPFKKVLWNNKITHNLFQKILSRINISEDEIYKIIENGFNKIKPRLTKSGDYCLYFTKSKFIVIFSYKKETDSILIVTILSYDMKTKDCIELHINEIKEFLNIEIEDNEFRFLNEELMYYNSKEEKFFLCNDLEGEKVILIDN